MVDLLKVVRLRTALSELGPESGHLRVPSSICCTPNGEAYEIEVVDDSGHTLFSWVRFSERRLNRRTPQAMDETATS